MAVAVVAYILVATIIHHSISLDTRIIDHPDISFKINLASYTNTLDAPLKGKYLVVVHSLVVGVEA